MKTLFMFLASIAVAMQVSAQSNNNDDNAPMKECVKMKDGKMWVVKTSTKTVTFSNGDQVMTNGTLKKKNGTTQTLKSGDCIDMQGNMVAVGTNSSSDRVKFKDGKLWTIKAMTSSITMSNGTVVQTNGMVKTKAGQTSTLTNGQSVDMNGNIKNSKS